MLLRQYAFHPVEIIDYLDFKGFKNGIFINYCKKSKYPSWSGDVHPQVVLKLVQGAEIVWHIQFLQWRLHIQVFGEKKVKNALISWWKLNQILKNYLQLYVCFFYFWLFLLLHDKLWNMGNGYTWEVGFVLLLAYIVIGAWFFVLGGKSGTTYIHEFVRMKDFTKIDLLWSFLTYLISVQNDRPR